MNVDIRDPWTARREREAQALRDDPFHKVREYNPRFKDLDFRAEYELILAKKSKLSARGRSFVVNMVELVGSLQEAKA